jgi:iron(III) transport system substrate-binding protein
MLKRGLIFGALVVVLALPFLLRPGRPESTRADDTLVVITPHNAAIREEYGRGFEAWYRERTGRTVTVDWRVVGGTSEIGRYLEGQYTASFQVLWTAQGKPWSAAVQAGFQNPRLGSDAPEEARQARAAFLASSVSCGIDVFYGGGTYDLIKQAAAGRLVDSGVRKLHPDWFTPEVMPRTYGGEDIWDAHDLWYGSVLSAYGILYNKDALARLGIDREPTQWEDLADPRYLGEVGLADPTKSGAIAAAFENVVQQQMHRRLDALMAEDPRRDRKAAEAQAVREGWIEGLRLLQRVGANARYFTDSSQKPPIDVAAGDCAAGMCIDFYGLEQQEALRRRGGGDRLGYASPAGGSAYSVDPVAVLRGAPHAKVALAFMEYVLSMEGQKVWAFKVGAPGGPERYALRRLPVRRDFYGHGEWRDYRSDPSINPYADTSVLVYHPEWTGALFQQLAFVVRLMTQDTHPELVAAWKAVLAAPEPARSRAMAALQDLSAVSYDEARGSIRKALTSKNQVDAVILAREMADRFRAQYAHAERIARGGD